MSGDGAVCVAYVHSNEVAHSWHLSLLAMLTHDVAHHQRVVRGTFLAMRCGTGGIVEARNQAAAAFVAGRDAEWLLWLDTDMGIAPDTADRLVAAADPVERPVVGALCFAQREYAPDGMGGFRTRPVPTLYRWVEAGGQSGFLPWMDYPRERLTRVNGTGSACILIHRDVLVKIMELYGPTWYTRMTNPTTRQLLSEDLAFCAKAAAAGYPIYVDTRVKTSHLKPIWLSENDYDWAAGDG